MRLPLAVVGSLMLSACDDDPARSVTIIARPPLSAAQAQQVKASARVPMWRPALCPPVEPSQGQGTFSVTGACAFGQTMQVNCLALGDDFFIEMSRPASSGATLRMFGNVERYVGPGSYAGNSLLISLQTDTEVFPWNAGDLRMRVDDGEQFVSVEAATLHAGSVRDAGTLSISGTLWCRKPPEPPRH